MTSSGPDPAFSVMTMDIISQVLARSDNPKELGNYLSEEIRELTGARCVLLIRGRDTPDDGGRQILTVHPPRRRSWAESPDVFPFFEEHLSDTKSSVWQESTTGTAPVIMNSRDRIGAVLTGTKPDRPAFAMTLSLYGARLTQCPLDRYFSDPSRYVAGQRAVYEEIGPDVLFGPFSFALLGAAFGGTIKEFPDQAPNLKRPAFTRPEDLADISLPDLDTCEPLLYHQQAVADLAAECGRDTPIAAILPFPIDLPALILGMDGWMETVLFNPEGTRLVIDTLMPFMVELANRLYAGGADFIVTPCAFASPAVVTRSIATSFARPVLEETLRQLKGPVVIHHGGAPVLPHLDLLTGMPSVIGYVVDARDDLSASRETIGPDSVLFGGPDNLSLPDRSAEELKAWCRRCLADRAEDPRYILCNSGPDVPYQTPLPNILAFKTAVASSSGR